MNTTQPRTISDRADGVRRQLRALVRDPEEWDVTDLHWFADLQTQLNVSLTLAVVGCRDNGATDGQIAEILGVTRQAVSKRWPGGGRFVGAAGRYRTAHQHGDCSD